MKNVRSLAIALALAAAACSGTTAEQNVPQTSANALTKAPVGTNTTGIVKVVGEALGEVPLRPDQRAELEKLAAAAETRQLASKDGHKELALAVADQIEKGSIDRTALQPKIDRVASDFQNMHTENQAAMQKMHALLDSDQRNAFVDALQAKLKEQHQGHDFKGRWAKMNEWKTDLKLTDDQISQIKDVMHAQHKQSPIERHAKGFDEGKKSLESFRTEKFEPMGKVGDLNDKVSKGTDHFIGLAEKVLPILTPEQRKIAADKIRDKAAKGELGPFQH
jgi:Spy/CpxP family protein refolding chaperone